MADISVSVPKKPYWSNPKQRYKNVLIVILYLKLIIPQTTNLYRLSIIKLQDVCNILKNRTLQDSHHCARQSKHVPNNSILPHWYTETILKHPCSEFCFCLFWSVLLFINTYVTFKSNTC